MIQFKEYKNLGPYTSMGWIFPSSIIVGLLIGYFFDKIFKTAPIGLLIFLFFGIIAGFVNLYRIFFSIDKKEKGEK
jgi:ATP synthase protein I